jgi:hypothetical protein
MKQLPWIIIVVLLVALMLQPVFCNKPAPAGNIVPKPRFDSLQKVYAGLQVEYSNYQLSADSAKENATVMAMQANEQLRASRTALEDAGATVNYLLRKLDSAATEKPDSTWVRVSLDYKDGCDSLRRANLTLNYGIIQYEQDAQAQANALAYEIHIRDSILNQERAFNAQFQRQLDYSIITGKQIEKAAKQKLSIWGGAALWGSKVSPLGGAEINLSIMTPREQMYEIKGAYINGWWVGIGTKIKFHF